jgi:hypothetical protein
MHDARRYRLTRQMHALAGHDEAINTLLVSRGAAVPVRETGHVLAFRPIHQVRVLVHGS